MFITVIIHMEYGLEVWNRPLITKSGLARSRIVTIINQNFLQSGHIH